MDSFRPDEAAFMARAIALAKNGEGRVAPNPPVGCVLVRDGIVVGEGWHDRCGGPHAEAMALRNAGGRARGATAYVTLSPCAAWGRQPPCADALADAGVAEVVAAVRDPNPKNASGLERLRELSVPARVGLLADEAEYVARGFFKRMRRGLPYVILKYAMTLDGKIADLSGDSRWVSGAASREMVQDMRSRADAVMVGIGTALADDPLLSVRDGAIGRRGGSARHPQPRRVVLDSRARLSPAAKMFSAPGGRVTVAICQPADSVRALALSRAGAETLVVPPGKDGGICLPSLLGRLAETGIDVVLCEGGAAVAAGLLREGLVDEVVVFVAPKMLGDGLSPVADFGPTGIGQAIPLAIRECIPSGDDIMIRGCLRRLQKSAL